MALAMPSAVCAIRLEGLTVRYGQTTALEDIRFAVAPGEVRGLLGANGSGKSTLVKVLAGLVPPAPGACLWIRDVPVDLPVSQRDLRALGVRFVHQDLALVNDLSVFDNVMLGKEFARHRSGLVDWKGARRAVRAVLEQVGLERVGLERVGLGGDDLDRPVGQLGPTQRVLVAVARATLDLAGGGVLVLDEPTASMDSQQVDRLRTMIRRLAEDDQVAVIFVGHRLKEVLSIVDSVTVLRDGREKVTTQAGGMTADTLLAEIQHAPLAAQPTGSPPRSHQSSESDAGVLVSSLSAGVLRNVSLAAPPGTVFGVTGLEGCGKDELVEVLSGQRRVPAGVLTVGGADCRFASPRDARRRGIVLVPADRKTGGGVGELTVQENLLLTRWRDFWRGRFRSRAARDAARELVERFQIVPPDLDRAFASLSGGNQQKVVLARSAGARPSVIVAHEPTNGIDAVSRTAVYAFLRDWARAGHTVVVVSGDLNEVATLCDSALVLVDGHPVTVLSGEELSESALLSAIFRSEAVA
jgi:ribose transport system ATP-binding protein